MTRHCGAPMLSWSSCNSPAAQLAGSKDPAFLPWTRKSAGFRSSHRDTPAPTHAQGTVPAGLRGIHVAEGNWDPIFKRKHPSSGENTPLPRAARNSRHSMALALRASFAVRRRVCACSLPQGEKEKMRQPQPPASGPSPGQPLILRAGCPPLFGAPALRRVVADQPAGWPTPCADFQHRDVLKAQSLGDSFWFQLSATRQKDEPVRFSGRNALLWVCSDGQSNVKSATLTRRAMRAGLSRQRERLTAPSPCRGRGRGRGRVRAAHCSRPCTSQKSRAMPGSFPT